MLTNQEVKKIVEELCGSIASLFPQNKIEAILLALMPEAMRSRGQILMCCSL